MFRRAFLGVFLLAALALPCAARSLVIQSFEATIEVKPDGNIVVTETIHPRFTGSWNGIYRSIPVEYSTPQGFNKTLFLEFISATDEDGNALKVESSRVRHYRKFKIWVPGASDAVRTVVLRYRVPNALLFLQDHDELYWNITGDEWEIPIESARALVELPSDATGIRTLVFTGAYHSTEHEADVAVARNEVTFTMRRVLSFREGLTAVVGWDKGFVHEPTATENAILFLRSNWPLFIPLAVFALMFWLWYTRGRDPKTRPISTQYSPPEGLTPGEAGTLIDDSADMRDITATLVDLAVRGFVLIEETKEQHMLGLWSDKQYVFHLRKKAEEWKELKDHERDLLDAIFSGGAFEQVKLSDLENKFYRDLPGIKDSIFEELMARKYFQHRPDRVRRNYLVGGAVFGGALGWLGVMYAAASGMQPAAFIVAGVLSAASICGFGWFMPARTIEGTRALEGVLGFEEFLGRVESDRFERMVKTPELFEKYLPFAMALGVEKSWTRAFEDIYRQPPEWYRGDFATFHPTSFVNSLNSMSSQAASAMTSAPRSSGGSGFGGGGFSGGGGGGGGGGGF